jgi:AraC-like DNA-binding protein
MNKMHDPAPSSEVPAHLRDAVDSMLCKVDYGFTDKTTQYWTVFSGFNLGGIDIIKHEGIGVRRGYRAPHHIRADHIDDFVVSVPTSAIISVNQYGRFFQVEPGAFVICSTATPSYSHFMPLAASDPFSMIHVRVSGSLLRRRIPRIDDCCGQPAALGGGAAKLMLSLFDYALHEGDRLSGGQINNLADMLAGAVANAAYEIPSLARFDTPSAYEKIRTEAAGFIDRNLSNPELNPALVARHCRVSLRYLHAAFSGGPFTVSAYIREARLQQCRIALQSLELRGKPVFDIARLWGFSDPSCFGRAYKARFGSAPGKERNLH